MLLQSNRGGFKMSFFYDEDGELKVGRIMFVIFIVIIMIIISYLIITPQYKVWSKGLRGKADLKEAEWNRQIAQLDAQAEIERAKGVAEANKIIAEGLKNNDEYLRYLWIQQLDGNDVIYVPTEANLPILEARG